MRYIAPVVVLLLNCACHNQEKDGPAKTFTPTFMVSASPAPWSTNLKPDVAITLIGYQNRYGEIDLRRLLDASDLVAITAEDGSSVPSMVTFSIRENEPMVFALAAKPAKPLQSGWYHLRIQPSLASQLTVVQEWIKKVDGLYDVPFRVGSEPLLLAISSCSGPSPIVQFKFSEPVAFPDGVVSSVSVSSRDENMSRSCAVLNNPSTQLDLACGDLGGTVGLNVRVSGVKSPDGLSVRAARSTINGFEGSITLAESEESGCKEWRSFDQP